MGLNFAIVGCGLIGNKRAAAIENKGRLIVVADKNLEKATSLAQKYHAEAVDEWAKVVTRRDVDVIIIATPHDQLTQIAMAAIDSGKHLLIEKPGARNLCELDTLIQKSQEKNVKVHVGFNHRFHPAILKASTLINNGELGELYYIRGRYGHGGRVGYHNEWRMKPEISGGGELIDQGAHLIDLSLFFFGEPFDKTYGVIQTCFWDIPVEDNAFLTLQTSTGKTAHLHATWTEWKNLFSFEITGKKAKLHIEGLGGSYGIERLSFYRMSPEMGPPETTIFEYPKPDTSWEAEIEHFIETIQNGNTCQPGLESTRQVLSVIESVYRQNKVPWMSKERM